MGNYDDYTAYFNGEWVPYSEVLFPPHDRGFAVADVVFDQGRTFGGVPFRLEDHVNRLYRSLKYVRVDPGFGEEEMLEVCREGSGEERPPEGRGWGLCDQPNYHSRGLGGRATECVRDYQADTLRGICKVLRGRGSRHHNQGAQLLQLDARRQGEAPQQDEFRAGGARGTGRRPGGTASSAGRGRQCHRGTRVQRVHSQRRRSQDAEG